MAEEPVNFERITKLYREESGKKSLTAVEPDFWDKVQNYLSSLESELAAARAKDPNSKASMLLQDELRKVLQKREQIYQYRERKLGLLAGSIAGGANTEVRGLARPEQDLLHRLVELLSDARSAAYGGTRASPVPAASMPPPGATPTPSAAVPSPRKGVIVHVLEDVPPFAGPDGTYRLKKEDVVVVHPSIAKVLTERGKARVVTPAP
ncbi:MAG: hypothetical protein E6K18_03330 [Methanobacteriota archaeon]|nr:MAG: hypothetical protein E6K18_03330 [Euryarchaeota archaeon]